MRSSSWWAICLTGLALALIASSCTGGDDDPFDPRDGTAVASQTASPADPSGTASPTPGDGTPEDGSPNATPEGSDPTGTATPSPTPEPPPAVMIDWSMAPRFGLDANNDGFTDYACNGGDDEAKFTSPSKRDSGAGCYQADPGTFSVTLDACDTAATGDAEFSWNLGGADLEQTACQITVELAEGSHDLVVSANAAGALVAGPTSQAIIVEDILIIAVGDSWTVGIGAPDVPGDSDAYTTWIDAVSSWLDAQTDLAQADKDLKAAEKALADATVIFDEADKAADEALDECFVTRFGARIIRVTGLGDCLDALADLGASFIEDVSKLDDRIADSVNDARRARDRAASAARNARTAATNAAAAVDTANAARKLAADESEGDYQHNPCKRSANAGPAQAARLIEEADPRTSVTLIHLSCSGARVTDLIGGTDQINLAAEITGERTVDLFLMGVGGNDLELNTVLGDLCPRQAACDSPEPPSTADGVIRAYCAQSSVLDPITGLIGQDDIGGACEDLYDDRLEDLKAAGVLADAPVNTSARTWFDQLLVGTLPSDACDSTPDPADLKRAGLDLRYDCVAGQIEQSFGARLTPANVVVWEYIDVVHDSNGALCSPGIPEGSGNEAARSLPGFTTAELMFADFVFDTINARISAAADRHGWTFVATNAGSRQHGTCADDNWIARVDQSLFNAPGASAIAHPTLGGMTYLGQALAAGVRSLIGTGTR